MFVVLCNVPPLDADRIALALVSERLAACVNAMPGITSTYQWRGAMCQEPETALWIKVAAAKIGALSDRIRELHPAEVPEIVVLPVDVARSDPRYVAWVRGEDP